MKTFSMVELQVYFRLDPSEEHQVAPGITVSRCGGPLLPFCQLIINAMNETGRILEERHHRTLGDYIVSTVASLRSSGKPGVASGLVADLASTLPTFSDQAMYEQSHEVSFARKAQRLVSDLHETLQEQDERFQFEDVDQISLDSGNAATAALCRSGVIQLPDDLSSVVGSLQDGEPGDGELALRAAVVTAGHDAARASGGAFSARELGYYLLSKAGDGDGPEGPQAYLTHGSAAY
ncbi:unnamed protein product [Ostreobium quekettii]|uniref:Queuosine 5'-phosphate N-glycosylase/hydrolase n=1 Tax=Ostreobium quekettii TaxID=121088 RepID=A0A8S1ITM3_9CHLO|nr:unnamed protein product [Ostreobium quekettii]